MTTRNPFCLYLSSTGRLRGNWSLSHCFPLCLFPRSLCLCGSHSPPLRAPRAHAPVLLASGTARGPSPKTPNKYNFLELHTSHAHLPWAWTCIPPSTAFPLSSLCFALTADEGLMDGRLGEQAKLAKPMRPFQGLLHASICTLLHHWSCKPDQATCSLWQFIGAQDPRGTF